MKVRKGFVSNSSSSSFCVVATLVKATGPAADNLEDYVYSVLDYGRGIDVKEYEGEYYVCSSIMHVDEYSTSSAEVSSVETANKDLLKFIEQDENLKVDGDPILLAGQRLC